MRVCYGQFSLVFSWYSRIAVDLESLISCFTDKIAKLVNAGFEQRILMDVSMGYV